jgi:chorismate mutase/prephenate dehydratase
MTDNINKIRKLIDKIDLDILRLLTTRGMLAQEIVEAKSNSSNKKIFRPEREAQILRKIINSNKGPLKDNHLYTIYREIISACLSLETDIKVTCLGPEGSFSNAALNKFFGSSVTTVFNNSISDVFSEVQTKKASYGVVPIENSYLGSINLTLEHLMNKQTIIFS